MSIVFSRQYGVGGKHRAARQQGVRMDAGTAAQRECAGGV
jgi:hypothetical protein